MKEEIHMKSDTGLDSLEFFIKTYSYKAVENRIFIDHELLIRICDGRDLMFDKIFWKDEKFAAVPGEKSMEITVVILENGGKRKEISAMFHPPGEQYHDFWHLGVRLYPGRKVRFAIGNEVNYSLTDEIDLNLL